MMKDAVEETADGLTGDRAKRTTDRSADGGAGERADTGGQPWDARQPWNAR
jgi:hypothetical protein